jgi:hypothetical protein
MQAMTLVHFAINPYLLSHCNYEPNVCCPFAAVSPCIPLCPVHSAICRGLLLSHCSMERARHRLQSLLQRLPRLPRHRNRLSFTDCLCMMATWNHKSLRKAVLTGLMALISHSLRLMPAITLTRNGTLPSPSSLTV